MMRTLKYIVLVACLAAACGGNKEPAKSGGAVAPAPNSTSAPPTNAPPAAGGTGAPTAAAKPAGDDLIGLASGAVVVDGPPGMGRSSSAWQLIDEDAETGLAQEAAQMKPIVIELPGRVQIDQLAIDDAKTELPERL